MVLKRVVRLVDRVKTAKENPRRRLVPTWGSGSSSLGVFSSGLQVQLRWPRCGDGDSHPSTARSLTYLLSLLGAKIDHEVGVRRKVGSDPSKRCWRPFVDQSPRWSL